MPLLVVAVHHVVDLVKESLVVLNLDGLLVRDGGVNVGNCLVNLFDLLADGFVVYTRREAGFENNDLA